MPKFEKGHAKVGGRSKGTRNLVNQIIEKCKAAEFDPVAEFLTQYKLVTDPAKAAQLILKFMEFIHPKLSSVDATIDDQTDPDKKPIPLTEETMLAFIKAARGS